MADIGAFTLKHPPMDTVQIEMVDIEKLFELNPMARIQAENIAQTRIMQTMQARIEELEKAPEFHPPKSSPVPTLDG
jgi:hypothetical protein